MSPTIKLVILILVSLFWSSGCQTSSDASEEVTLLIETTQAADDSPTLVKTNTPIPEIPTSTLQPKPTHTIIPTPLPAETPAQAGVKEEEWLTYRNELHGFSLQYPETWSVVEFLDRNQISLIPRGSGVALRIRFKFADEEIDILRTGVPAGELINRGEVYFLGQGIAKNVLFWKGADRAVLYDNSGEIRRGNLVLTIVLEGSGYYEDKIIPEAIQLEADEILTTFSLHSEE